MPRTEAEPLECGYFVQCVEDAGHEWPHRHSEYPDWVVPAIEPMAFIQPTATLDEARLARALKAHYSEWLAEDAAAIAAAYREDGDA